jgi:hypothetical protein
MVIAESAMIGNILKIVFIQVFITPSPETFALYSGKINQQISLWFHFIARRIVLLPVFTGRYTRTYGSPVAGLVASAVVLTPC